MGETLKVLNYAVIADITPPPPPPPPQSTLGRGYHTIYIAIKRKKNTCTQLMHSTSVAIVYLSYNDWPGSQQHLSTEFWHFVVASPGVFIDIGHDNCDANLSSTANIKKKPTCSALFAPSVRKTTPIAWENIDQVLWCYGTTNASA